LKKGPLSCEHASQLLDQLAQALQFTHEQGLVHRDIKPSNILMRDEHFIYLADFGLAKYIDEIGGLTLRDYILGTPEYMAPEELAEDKATPLSDLYSLGILLYQMVTGKLPFTANNAINVCIKHLHDFPPIPSSFNANISETVESVILRALEKDPQRRFQTVREFSQAYWQALQKDRYAQMMAVTQLIPVLKVPQVNVYKMRQSPRRRTLASTMLALTVLASIPIIFGLSTLSHGQSPSPVQAQQVSQPPHANVLLSKPTPIPTPTPVHPAVMMESSLNPPNVQNNTPPVSTGGSKPPADNQYYRDQSRHNNRPHHHNHNNAFPDLPSGDPFANGNGDNGNGFPNLPGSDPFANGNRDNGNGFPRLPRR
ncbi:MAG TPA: serine/threonine-protein kinase, partial [Ktedonobacteraceae bacterium]|nr:serine/threonine-protein kinase [Ktedonobacteraceae bacterium]